jgi:hypothetical protein
MSLGMPYPKAARAEVGREDTAVSIMRLHPGRPTCRFRIGQALNVLKMPTQ